MQHADDVIQGVFEDRHARVIARRQLLREQCRFLGQVERLDVVARSHHVVDGDRVEIEKIGQHGAMLAAEIMTFEHQTAHFLLRQRDLGSVPRIEPEQLEQTLHEKIDEPDDRRRRLEHRRQDVAHQRREPDRRAPHRRPWA